MGLLALPQMLRAGYDVRLSAGVITAGGCLGILIPPSVLLIVYGATAGVSVVQLYAGAFFPGIMLAGLYILYVIIMAKIKPAWAPPLTEAQRFVPLPAPLMAIGATGDGWAVSNLFKALNGKRNQDVSTKYLLGQLGIALAAGDPVRSGGHLQLPERHHGGAGRNVWGAAAHGRGRQRRRKQLPGRPGRTPLPVAGWTSHPARKRTRWPPRPAPRKMRRQKPRLPMPMPSPSPVLRPPPQATRPSRQATTKPASMSFWIGLAVGLLAMVIFYAILSFTRLEVFKMLLSSFFPLLVLIMSVLGSIVFGLATPTEAAAVGAFGGFLLAAAYRQLTFSVVKESVFLTAKTSAMVCWLFVGSAIFSAAFALLGGQELVETWVLSMNLSKTEFLILSQVLIFILGWPLEWTEIIVIFMPIFIPLLDNFGVDPLFFGLLVALNLQTAFLSPPWP